MLMAPMFLSPSSTPDSPLSTDQTRAAAGPPCHTPRSLPLRTSLHHSSRNRISLDSHLSLTGPSPRSSPPASPVGCILYRILSPSTSLHPHCRWGSTLCTSVTPALPFLFQFLRLTVSVSHDIRAICSKHESDLIRPRWLRCPVASGHLLNKRQTKTWLLALSV